MTSSPLRLICALLLSSCALTPLRADPLDDGFKEPPASARPRVWWHWMNGNVTEEGIKLDLDWMKRIGIGGVQNFDVQLQTPQVVGKRLVYMTPKAAMKAGTRLFLDLGDVRELAEVVVDGKSAGIAWKPPYRVELTGMVKPGANSLEVRVTNLWVNRLIGDAQPGAMPITFTTTKPYRADAPLRQSGMMGPVTLVIER